MTQAQGTLFARLAVALLLGCFHLATMTATASSGLSSTWGKNDSGQLGVGTAANADTALRVSNLGSVTALAGEKYFSMALKSDGSVAGWDRNGDRSLGNGTTMSSLTLILTRMLTGATGITCGD
jgi:alpha-tubulin suppressor-like RCC1 family protein